MEQLLLENPYYGGNSDASEAMSLAAGYREQGMTASQALTEAWREVKGESSNPLDIGNASPTMLLLLALAAFTAIWKLVKKQWPWESLQLSQRKMLARPAPRPINPAQMREVLNPEQSGARTINPSRNTSEETTGIITV